MYEELRTANSSDSFVTETLADFTQDDQQAIKLYELAISQSTAFAGEPIYTKRIALASRYIDIGELNIARNLLIQARDEANNLGDTGSVKDVDELLAEIVEQ